MKIRVQCGKLFDYQVKQPNITAWSGHPHRTITGMKDSIHPKNRLHTTISPMLRYDGKSIKILGETIIQ
jgi:hypothetical protein